MAKCSTPLTWKAFSSLLARWVNGIGHQNSVLSRILMSSESRNLLLTYWYDKTDASHLLFIDADMGFDPQLIFDMVEFDKPVVGVIYPKKTIDLDRLATLTSSGQPTKQAKASSHDFVVRRPASPALHVMDSFKLTAAEQASFSFSGHVSMSCCRKYRKFLIPGECKMPDILNFGEGRRVPKAFDRSIRAFEYLTVDGQRLTEDYSFCHRWHNQCGGEIWANIAYEIVHMGPHRFRARYSDALAPRVRVIHTPITKVSREIKSSPVPDKDF